VQPTATYMPAETRRPASDLSAVEPPCEVTWYLNLLAFTPNSVLGLTARVSVALSALE
jgi:hypothetical protein